MLRNRDAALAPIVRLRLELRTSSCSLRRAAGARHVAGASRVGDNGDFEHRHRPSPGRLFRGYATRVNRPQSVDRGLGHAEGTPPRIPGTTTPVADRPHHAPPPPLPPCCPLRHPRGLPLNPTPTAWATTPVPTSPAPRQPPPPSPSSPDTPLPSTRWVPDVLDAPVGRGRAVRVSRTAAATRASSPDRRIAGALVQNVKGLVRERADRVLSLRESVVPTKRCASRRPAKWNVL